MQDSNLRLPKGAPDRGTAAGDAGEPPQDLSLCRDPKGRGERGQCADNARAEGERSGAAAGGLRAEQTVRRVRHVPAPRRFPMFTTRVRLRPVLTAVIALLPLILAACNNGGSSGY